MVASLAVALALSSVASAAPDNKNTGLLDVSCGPPIGDTTIQLIEHGGTLSFWSDPSLPDNPFHAVFKRGVLDGTDTITIEGGPTFFLHDAFTLPGGSGMGYEDRLVECSAEITDEEDFKLTAHNAAILIFLGAPPEVTQFIGASAHRFTTGTFHFEVVVTG